MKRTFKLAVLTALSALFLAAVAFAQMGMGMSGTSGQNNQMMGRMSPDSTNAVMMRMSRNHMMMDRDLMKMRDHMQSMMKMDDMTALHSEMQKQMEMMQSMQKMMGEQGRMYRMMMGPEGMNGMGMKEMPRKTMAKEDDGSKPMQKDKNY